MKHLLGKLMGVLQPGGGLGLQGALGPQPLNPEGEEEEVHLLFPSGLALKVTQLLRTQFSHWGNRLTEIQVRQDLGVCHQRMLLSMSPVPAGAARVIGSGTVSMKHWEGIRVAACAPACGSTSTLSA